MKKLKTMSFFKSVFLSFLLGIGLFLSFQPQIQVYAKDNSGYFLGVAPDFDRFMYQTNVAVEEHNVRQKNFKEFKSLDVEKNFDDKIPTDLTDSGWKADKGGDGKNCMFLFPTCGSDAADQGPDSKDSNAITRVNTQVLNQLNQAIAFVMSNATEGGVPLIAKDYSETEKKELFFKITAELGNVSHKMKPKGIQNGTFTIKDTTFKVTKKSETSSFLTLETADGKKTIQLRYRIQKYPEGKVANSSDQDRSGAFPTLYWFHFVWMGNATYINQSIDAMNISKLGSEGLVAGYLYDLLDSTLQGIRSKLGLDTITNIVFNQGTYKIANWNGIAPLAWFEAGNILFFICQIIAWIVLALALIWRLGNTMWGTLTPYKRVTMIEGIKDVMTGAVSTALIYPFFMLITKFNVLLVDIMGNLSIFNDHIDSSSVGGGTIAGILLAVLFFGIEIYFNFVYRLRAITIVLLYGMTPVFFMVYAFGGGFKGITMKFIKELIGNVFIHTFHATFLAFFAIFMNTANAGFFNQLVLLYAFVPMTKLFKELTGIGESNFISSTAEQAKDTMKSAGTAVAGGAIGGFVAGKTMKGGLKGGGDNGGGGGGSKLSGDSMAGDFGGNTSGSLTKRIGGTIAKKALNTTAGKALANSQVGQAGAAVAKLAAKGGSKAASLYNSSGGKVLRSVGKAAAGASLAASGAILGNKELAKAGRTLTSSGVGGAIDSGKAFASDLEEKIHGREVQSNDPSHIGGYYNDDHSVRTDTYDQSKLHENTGVMNMDIVKGKNDQQIMRQKIDPSKLSEENRKFLESIKTDANGNVESSQLRDMGLNHIKRTADNKYILSYDAEKRGVHQVKRSANKLIVSQSGSNGVWLNHLDYIRQDHVKQTKETQNKKAFML